MVDLVMARPSLNIAFRPNIPTLSDSPVAVGGFVGVQEAVGLLQGTRGGAGRQGISVGQGFRLPADEVMPSASCPDAVLRRASSLSSPGLTGRSSTHRLA